ncbi:hypothetical protein N431DRAFT_490649 [Stipitochalara longipes BDJ]|nr:hypothetical protein N431DRAFT_490649 [Stipitochalara longipes BDJ]
MAPTAPKKRPSMRSKTSSKSGSGLISRPPTSTSSSISLASSQPPSEPSFINSKKDRRTIKHSAFLSRIEKTSKKPLKRRRPSKKLVTTLEGLADALPSVSELVEKSGGAGGKMGGKGKSLKSKPGALKRKEKLERGERERFGKNLAVILGSRGVEKGDGIEVEGKEEGNGEEKRNEVVKGRFAALRAWVGTNMEKHPAFEKGTE